MNNSYEEQVLEVVRNANASSSREGHWSNLNDIVRTAKALGIKVGFGWNKIEDAICNLEHTYLLEHKTFETFAGFEERWRDSTYTLEKLREVHKTNS